MTEQLVFEKEDVGQLISDEQGWRVIGAVIRLAVTCGFEITPSETTAVEAFENEYPKYEDAFGITRETPETILSQNGLADRALAWLNANRTPDGCVFHFHDGGFYLSELPKEGSDG